MQAGIDPELVTIIACLLTSGYSEVQDWAATMAKQYRFEAELATGRYPQVSKLLRGDLRTAIARLMETFSGEKATDRRFERGLKALLDGFEANLPKPRKRRS